jgi:hypothetical protein
MLSLPPLELQPDKEGSVNYYSKFDSTVADLVWKMLVFGDSSYVC